MLGYYNYTVILTYIGLVSSIIGINLAMLPNANVRGAVVCLVISGVCDMFDGKIARTAKNRTEEEKIFGIQIDSLCDLICFGIFPIIIAYSMGMRATISPMGIINGTVIVLFILAAVIRLSYFNVTEEIRQRGTDECRKIYQGLPVTSIAIIFPLYFEASRLMNTEHTYSLPILMFVVASLFVINIEVRKPNTKEVVALVTMALAVVIRYVLRRMGVV